MNIVIIGSGNVATVLGRQLKKNGLNILQVVSRDINHAELLSQELQSGYTDFNGIIDVNADIYLLALSDTAFAGDLSFLKLDQKIVLHTAGSVSSDVLKKISPNYGVFYPLQTLSKHQHEIPAIPFLIEGSNLETLQTIRDLAMKISNQVEIMDDISRQKIHIAAVMVNNFTNHLFHLAEKFCREENINFDLLKPLIQETAHKIATMSPMLAQTGPAKRKDLDTINQHLQLLEKYPEIKEIYTNLTNSIINN